MTNLFKSLPKIYSNLSGKKKGLKRHFTENDYFLIYGLLVDDARATAQTLKIEIR